MADLSKTVGIIFRAQDQASGAVDKLAENLKTVGSSAGSASGKVGDLDTQTEKLGNSAKSVEFLANALKTLAASIVVKDFIDANVALENFTKSMTLVTGSSQEAGREFQWLKELANTLGLNVRDASDAYVQLSASTKGTALAGDQTRAIFEAVSKAMSSLGKSSADTQGALLAISQIVSKGTVSMEELRGQLGERLPGAFQIAAKSMGLTTQELDALVSSGNLAATDFLPRFTKELNATFGETKYVDTFAAAMARLRNALDELSQSVGKAGVFDAITAGISLASKGVKLFGVQFKEVSEVIGAFRDAYSRRSFSGLADAITEVVDRYEIEYQKLGKSVDSVNESFAETSRLARKAAEAASELDALNQSTAETARLLRQNVTESEKLAQSLAALGIDPKKVKDPIDQIIGAFGDLASNSAASGEQILAGLEKGLSSTTSFDQINRIGGALTTAFTEGRTSADEFAQGVLKLADASAKVEKQMDRTTGETEKQEKALGKAEESAAKLKLEMEKLASNERIKTIEFKVNLEIERVKANAQIVVAIFESLNNTINSTADVIGSVFDKFGSQNLNSVESNALFEQLSIENKIRREAFDLQKELTKAQIENITAQTRNLQSGNALIKIDGAGLQPHLEAFMWEILKSIQTRVNRDGLKLLLGV